MSQRRNQLEMFPIWYASDFARGIRAWRTYNRRAGRWYRVRCYDVPWRLR